MAFLKAESYKKGIIQSSAVNVTGKLIAFVQQWLIGFYFGSYSGTDLFFFTYNIILFVSFFFLNLTTSVIVPESIRIRAHNSGYVSVGFVNVFIVLYGGVSLLLTLAGLMATESVFGTISSFPPDVISENVGLIKWCVPLVFLLVFINLLTEILASYKYFTMPNIVNAVNSLLSVVFVVVFHDSLGLQSVAMGLVAGALINVVVVVLMMKKQLGWKFRLFEFGMVKNVFSYGVYAQLGFMVYLIALYVPQYMFSQFQEGSLTAMNYADKISSVPGIFLITQITNVMAIKFNDLVSRNDSAGVAALIERLMLYVSGGLLLLSAVICFTSDWIVNLLFGMTDFSVSSLKLTSDLLALMCLYLPVGFVFNMFVRIFNAYAKQKYVLLMQVLTQGCIILLYYLLIPSLGELSFPVLRLIPYSLTAFAAIFAIRHLCPVLRTGRVLLVYSVIMVLLLLSALYFLFV